jgi:hypothetical protein
MAVPSRLVRKVGTLRGVEQLVARQAHNLEVGGSSPFSATKFIVFIWFFGDQWQAGWNAWPASRKILIINTRNLFMRSYTGKPALANEPGLFPGSKKNPHLRKQMRIPK